VRPEVHLTTFAAAHRDGAVVIDVREPAEYAVGHVDGAVLIPVGDVVARAGQWQAAPRPGYAPATR